MKAKFIFGLALAMAVGSFQVGNAAGFALIEQSVKGLGVAFAGGAASAEDASTIFYNPAGMTYLGKNQALFGTHFVVPKGKFHDKGTLVGSDYSTPPAPFEATATQAVVGNEGGDSGVNAPVPNMYFATSCDCCWWFGVGVNVPFGLSTRYDPSWVGRYHAIESAVETFNVNPSVAYRFTDWLSIGGGVSLQYIHARITNAVDFGSILNANTNGALGTPQGSDGYTYLSGDTYSWGGNFGMIVDLGVLSECLCDARLGFHWRSEIKHDIKGKVRYLNVPVQLAGTFQNAGAKAHVRLPQSFSTSLYLPFCESFALVADATYTKWDVLQELRFIFDSAQPDGVTTLKWDNSWRLSTGLIYDLNPCLRLRTGFAYDQEPIPDRVHRTPRIPGEDRYWLAFGASWSPDCCVTFDLGYAHLWVDDPVIDKRGFDDIATYKLGSEDTFKGGLYGEYDAHVDIVSAQVAVNF